jgi:alkanesulfonate monooxygenase SsuD/methylene tetrahydromethanopterin reductase-like flavin-dependent oxidoreductase (luciferase family)
VGVPQHHPRARRAVPLLQQTLEGEIPVDTFHEADMFIVGDPEQCFEKMRRYADLGVDQMVCRVEYGHLSHEHHEEHRAREGSASGREVRRVS